MLCGPAYRILPKLMHLETRIKIQLSAAVSSLLFSSGVFVHDFSEQIKKYTRITSTN